MPQPDETGFKVTDRRKFKADGSPREDAEIQEQSAPVESIAVESPAAETTPRVDSSEAGNVLSFPADSAKQNTQSAPRQVEAAAMPKEATQAAAAEHTSAGSAEQAYNQARGPQTSQMPEASFLGLVNMLGVEAAMHMGLIQSPGEETQPPDFESARHLIDILGILQTKTRGNLTTEEDNLFEGMLADLRMQFVAVSRRR